MTKKFGGKTTDQFKNDVLNILGKDYEVLENYKNNKTPILIKHKICNREYRVTPQSVIKGGGCKLCHISKVTKTNEEFTNEVYGLVGDEYTFLEKYCGSKKSILIRHNLCGNEYKVLPNSFLRGNRCKKCTLPNYDRDTIRYKEEVQFKTNGEYEVLGDYIDYNAKILMKHKLCNTEWRVTPKRFLGENTRCPYCAKQVRIKSHSDFVSEVYSLVSDKYTVLTTYERSNRKITIKHNLCNNIYKVTPNSFLKGCRCPQCSSNKNSKYSQMTTKILDENKIKYKKEFWFEDCKDKLYLYYDFAIFDKYNQLKCLIEVDGEQHFHPVRFYGIDEKDAERIFNETVRKDNIKNNYCKSHNIKLIRIPYWEFYNEENIKNILHNNSIL